MMSVRKRHWNFAMDGEIYGETIVWSTAHWYEKDLVMMLGLNDAIDQLAMANCVHQYWHMLTRERMVIS